MSAVWPEDVLDAIEFSAIEPLRPFRCLMLMPFKPEFEKVSETIREVVEEIIEARYQEFNFNVPRVKRLDWFDTAGVIHDQLWRELASADLVFCDITELNPNVMYELGVAAAWKKLHQVVLIKRKGVKQRSVFDISPVRYFEYELKKKKNERFRQQIAAVTETALLGFPDSQITSADIQIPMEIDYSSGIDDPRLYTPPYSHRRVREGAFEFGSLFSYPHSWASVGNLRLLNVSVSFLASFVLLSEEKPNKIGIALRSQHFYANFGHIVVLGADGSIEITQPNNTPPKMYADIPLRPPTEIDPYSYHSFSVSINEEAFRINIDDFSHEVPIDDMERVNSAGLIRFHATRSWMAIKSIKLGSS